MLPLYPIAAFQFSQQTDLVFTAWIGAGMATAVAAALLVFCTRDRTAPRPGRRAAAGDGPRRDADDGPLSS
ncbi:hypothetical protein [Streptomyces collinus]|uniref:hypothetical protein n=1 Tax=Streptomyces collinus TaxID=42684 RepID=UPI0036449CD3